MKGIFPNISHSLSKYLLSNLATIGEIEVKYSLKRSDGKSLTRFWPWPLSHLLYLRNVRVQPSNSNTAQWLTNFNVSYIVKLCHGIYFLKLSQPFFRYMVTAHRNSAFLGNFGYLCSLILTLSQTLLIFRIFHSGWFILINEVTGMTFDAAKCKIMPSNAVEYLLTPNLSFLRNSMALRILISFASMTPISYALVKCLG